MSFILSACGDQQKTNSSNQDNSTNGSNIPQPTIPQPTIPQPTIPQPTIPIVQIPVITFPEITIPNIKIQQDKNTTVYTLPADILFDFDKANLRPDAEAALQQISNSIAQRFTNVPVQIQINGHTDSVGGNTYNMALSKRRAESVEQWLIAHTNLKPNQITVEGLGETEPVAPNTNPDGSDNPQGRQQNRRVEIVVRNISS